MSETFDAGRDPHLRMTRRQALGGLGAGLAAGVLAQSAPAEARSPLAKPPDKGGTASSPPLARRGCTATALRGGLILVAGGFQTSPTGAVQLFDPEHGQWLDAAPMNTPRYYHAAAALHDGRVLVVGGKFLQVLSSAEIYDPRQDTWTLVAPMNGPRMEHGAAASDRGGVLVTGGFYRAPLSSAELYDQNADLWTLL